MDHHFKASILMMIRMAKGLSSLRTAMYMWVSGKVGTFMAKGRRQIRVELSSRERGRREYRSQAVASIKTAMSLLANFRTASHMGKANL
jgi:hypothetical protein